MAKATTPSRPASKPIRQPAGQPLPRPATNPQTGLHYDRDLLVAGYQNTYSVFIKALMVGVVGALIYFFIFIVYLGGWSHTPGTTFVEEFSGRVPVDYTGQKLPMYDNAELAKTYTMPLNESAPRPAEPEAVPADPKAAAIAAVEAAEAAVSQTVVPVSVTEAAH